MAAQGKVYFALSMDGSNLMKIGWSSDTQRRVVEIQTHAPFPIAIVAEIPGTRKLESFFHECFEDCREHGEWFRVEGALLAAMLADRSHFVIDAAYYWMLSIADQIERQVA